MFGQSVEPFEDGADAGRDGAFRGRWRDELADEDLVGNFVVQAKFSAISGATLSLSDVTAELNKVEALVQQGICDVYVLMTNAKVTGNANDAIRRALMDRGVGNVRIWARTWIAQQLDESTLLRRSVPRIYGLGDLTEILDERQSRQAASVLRALGANVSTFVTTSAYLGASRTLREHAGVMLLGGPTVGKSVIAQMLTLGLIDELGVEAMKPTKPEQFLASWNPSSNAPRAYWIDDAFGELSMDGGLVSEWARNMPSLLAARAEGNFFIFTSRDYIYREARTQLKDSQYRFWADSQIEIHVADVGIDDRERILYNHLKLGNQPKEFKTAIKSHLGAVARLEEFTPGLAFRLGNSQFTANLNPSSLASVQSFFKYPSQYLAELLTQMTVRDRAALGFLFAMGGELVTPLHDVEQANQLLDQLGSSVGELGEALAAHDGSFVKSQPRELGTVWSFAHPTIRQATNELLQAQPGSIAVLISGTPIPELVVQLDFRPYSSIPEAERGRYLAVPEALADEVVRRIVAFWAAEPIVSYISRGQLADLLAKRASRAVRQKYILAAGDQLLQWGSTFHWNSSAAMFYELAHREGTLPETARALLADSLSDVAIKLESCAWIDSPLLYDEERDAISQDVRSSLLDHKSVISVLEDQYPTETEPARYLEDYWYCIDDYRDRFSNEDYVLNAIALYERALGELEGRLEETHVPEEYSSDSALEDDVQMQTFAAQRDTFDDVDA